MAKVIIESISDKIISESLKKSVITIENSKKKVNDQNKIMMNTSIIAATNLIQNPLKGTELTVRWLILSMFIWTAQST